MQHSGYLPKESEFSDLNKSIMRTVWSNKLIVSALGLRNENEAREWFRLHPDVHHQFESMNQELQVKINELQERAKNGLQEIVVRERRQFLNYVNLTPHHRSKSGKMLFM